MKRSAFKRTQFGNRKPREPEPASEKPSLKPLSRGVYGVAELRAAPKENALQHEGYMNLVRAMPCARCGKGPRSQFCHADEGKGTGIKTDCRRGWHGCPECHYLVGSTGDLGKQGRREIEAEYAHKTRAQIMREGLWPKGLGLWADERC